jgi:hypothetical protein
MSDEYEDLGVSFEEVSEALQSIQKNLELVLRGVQQGQTVENASRPVMVAEYLRIARTSFRTALLETINGGEAMNMLGYFVEKPDEDKKSESEGL